MIGTAATGETATHVGRGVADHQATTWTQHAIDEDRHFRRLALGVGLGGGLLALMAWLYIIVETQSPWWWAGLVAVIIAWIVVGLRISRW